MKTQEDLDRESYIQDRNECEENAILSKMLSELRGLDKRLRLAFIRTLLYQWRKEKQNMDNN